MRHVKFETVHASPKNNNPKGHLKLILS